MFKQKEHFVIQRLLLGFWTHRQSSSKRARGFQRHALKLCDLNVMLKHSTNYVHIMECYMCWHKTTISNFRSLLKRCNSTHSVAQVLSGLTCILITRSITEWKPWLTHNFLYFFCKTLTDKKALTNPQHAARLWAEIRTLCIINERYNESEQRRGVVEIRPSVNEK